MTAIPIPSGQPGAIRRRVQLPSWRELLGGGLGPRGRTAVQFATAVVAAGTGLGLAFALAIPAVAPFRAVAAWEPPPPLKIGTLAARSTIVAADGSVLSVLHDGQDRVPVPLERVSPIMVHALLDVEDAGFFSHRGVDGRGVARALVADAGHGRIAQGGSTITQQLVKLELLSQRRDLSRKFREMTLALRLEKQLTKREILERYLNLVYFGSGASGIEVAAERYFGTDASSLDVAQSALLAGLVRSPRADNPFAHPDAARRRRDVVIDRMLVQGHVDRSAAEQARATPLPVAPQYPRPNTRDAFGDEVVRTLVNDSRLGPTRTDREHQLFAGGLTVHTTIDPRAQAAAEQAVSSGLPNSPFRAALVAIDPHNGYVRALVGRSTTQTDGFDLATDGARQAGSSFKMITLAAAVEAGHSPLDLVDATAPCVFPGSPPWNVHNYEDGVGGDVTLWDATVHSLNCAYARAVEDLGPEKVVAMASRLGVRRHLDAVPSITLGTEEVAPIEMATVAATFAADGVRHDPVFVTRVEDAHGSVLLDNTTGSDGARAVAPQVARTVTAVLQDVVRRGTGKRAAIGRPEAGKTGTTEQWSDAWFVGYTPDLAAAVWMGSPEGRVPMRGVGGINVTGGSFPARMWASFMGAALAAVAPTPFPAPDIAAWGSPGRIGPAPVAPPAPAAVAPSAGPAAPPPPPSTPTPAPASTTTTEKKKHGD